MPEQDVLYLSMDSERRAMCCAGCKSVAEFIVNAGLSDYYKHRKELPDKIDSASLMQSTDWQAFDRANFDSRIGPDVHEVILDIEGLHCVSCSWLVKNKLENQCEIKVISLDHQTGIAVIQWDKNKTPLSSILHSINSLGYLPHVLDQENGELQQELSDQNSENSLKRLVVAGLGMMQVMMFAVALYTGNEQNMENVYRRFLIWVSMLVSFPVLFYSGMPFLRHAWQSIRLHRMHMDIPIAIAMLSAFSLSVVNSFSGTGEVYFDSVVMFVFFLSVSRYIQEQVSRKMLNSRQALARMLPVFVEIEENGQLLKKPLTEIKLGEKIAIPIGAVIPADGVINSGRTEIDASSLSGESRPLVCKQGDAVFAGMRNLGQPISITTTAITKHSALSVLSQRLKRAKFTSEQNQLSLTRYVTAFIAFTLLLATCVFIYWNLHRDWQYGFEIALAVLVVSCPCALSIALPSGVASLTRYLHKQG
ncbi:MAG: heavy metal translocating P-type ATPase, partial [Gammaproteobacteria bacterium]|nr:heavy metal translocating P-type ATPase [Gammaproteobacteria bacterium]